MFQRIAKFIVADFYEINFMKGIVISGKVDKMYDILRSLLATGCWSRDEGSKVLQRSTFISE